jgi:hypothetical protein
LRLSHFAQGFAPRPVHSTKTIAAKATAWKDCYMEKLFASKAAGEAKRGDLHVRLSVADYERIVNDADARQLSLSDHVRRTMLGKKSDLRYESEIVLALNRLVASVRELTRRQVERGLVPTTDELAPIISGSIAALLLIKEMI